MGLWLCTLKSKILNAKRLNVADVLFLFMSEVGCYLA